MSILLDDSDPLVQYLPTGGWSTSGETPEFEATAHASATLGATANLTFEGTSISVYGSIAPNSGHSSLNFSIDGVDIDSYRRPVSNAVHNQLFWKSPVFNETQHTLVVTVLDSDSESRGMHDPFRNPAFYLDYFIYNTTSTAGKTLLIDDTDASVTYSADGWRSDNDTDTCLESTQHVSASVGSWAAVSFNGTGISVVGSASQASIVIDGSQPVLSQPQIENQLFNKSDLPPGLHTINITFLAGNSLGIDYFLVTNSQTPSTAQSQSTPQLSGTSQLSKKPPIARIVGGAVGGLALLILLLAVVLVVRRRRAARVDQSDPMAPAPHPWDVERRSIASMTTIANDLDGERPQTFEKERLPSRYIYYDDR
ncbi:hypothetical protein MSAN_01135700 [Mycena sanguinolenta]|uniref:Uncharacterized protein n=1 Tax=Mycena sanguinolenta TaxID=230812 RepID=A0A8H6YH41_9AGAR|nr:hypothetical protein MSAN_01135700 [Mycena sanguinolenta]